MFQIRIFPLFGQKFHISFSTHLLEVDRVWMRRPDVVVHGGVPLDRGEGAEPAGFVLRADLAHREEGRLQQRRRRLPRRGRVRGLFERDLMGGPTK